MRRLEAIRRRLPGAEEKGRWWRKLLAAGRKKKGGGWTPRALGREVTRLPGAEAHRSGEGVVRRRGRQRGRGGLDFGSVEKKRR